jgi:Tetrapyrrole (Corrin/Porphyrin) Methylases
MIQRGIEVEVLPGVSSAVAVPPVAGIPPTYRGSAVFFGVIAGHRQQVMETEPREELDPRWARSVAAGRLRRAGINARRVRGGIEFGCRGRWESRRDAARRGCDWGGSSVAGAPARFEVEALRAS